MEALHLIREYESIWQDIEKRREDEENPPSEDEEVAATARLEEIWQEISPASRSCIERHLDEKEAERDEMPKVPPKAAVMVALGAIASSLSCAFGEKIVKEQFGRVIEMWEEIVTPIARVAAKPSAVRALGAEVMAMANEEDPHAFCPSFAVRDDDSLAVLLGDSEVIAAPMEFVTKLVAMAHPEWISIKGNEAVHALKKTKPSLRLHRRPP